MEKEKNKLAGDVLDEKDEEKDNESNPKLNTGDPKPSTKFIGFYRNEGNDLWGLHPQALSREESIINKIKITYGDVEIHIVSTELPE